MKAIVRISAILMVVAMYACKKADNSGNANLIGKWTLTETLADPGNGSGKWTKVPTKITPDYVKFDSDGKLSSSVLPDYASYIVKDSITLTFTKPDKTIQNYWYHIEGSQLSMSPAGPIYCYEPCGIRFAK